MKYFIDLFSGCGGLSLGLCQAGWSGMFAAERDSMAFQTFEANFLSEKSLYKFHWPGWLEKKPWDIAGLLRENRCSLSSLRGKVALIAGGPPCQGFSLTGRRRRLDPRNMLFKKYVEVVDLVRPDAVLVENVVGMRLAHDVSRSQEAGRSGRRPKAFSDRLVQALESLGYAVSVLQLDASEFGVPQRRSRLFIIGFRRQGVKGRDIAVAEFVNLLEKNKTRELSALGIYKSVSAQDAISDLELGWCSTIPCTDPSSRSGFMEISYRGPRTSYQRFLRDETNGLFIDSCRLARHSRAVAHKFKNILVNCEKGVSLSAPDRARLGIKKYRVHPMDGRSPAPTITTLPDDVLHYSEPRILTVRECARLQTFPDWFVFRGKYTTGGKRRVKECPRYTQVGNAVPPLLSRILGRTIFEYLSSHERPSELEKVRRAG